MIIINEKLKNGFTLSYENFPHLFDENNKQKSDFFCEFDVDCNLIVETTINDANELKKKLDNYLCEKLASCVSIIKQAETAQKQKKEIKIMLGMED